MTSSQTHNHFIVVEEFGHAHYLGILPSDENVIMLRNWWENIEDMLEISYNPAKEFPGRLVEIEDILHSDDESNITIMIDTDGDTHTINRDSILCTFHTHNNSNSYMQIFNDPHIESSFVYHKGHTLDTENDLDSDETIEDAFPHDF